MTRDPRSDPQPGAWLARTAKDNKDKRDRKIFDLWLACYTMEEIAEITAEPVGTVKRLLGNGSDDLVQKVLAYQTNQISASHADGFQIPIYNVWKQQEKTEGSSHFGKNKP